MTRAVSGVLVLDKPAGISSRQALDRITHLLPRVKIGHAGTLDPLATGVLVVCVGKTTRLIPYVQRMCKEYQATLRLGQRSDTHDLEGQLEAVPMRGPIARESLESRLQKFCGNILQRPPQHSAVHVRGRRAYEIARAGKEVALAPRTVHVEQLLCTRFDFPEAELHITCSSGTYVRSLVRDIGEDLGCGAVMTRLVRTRIGIFRLHDAVALDELSKSNLWDRLRPTSDALRELECIRMPAERCEDVRHGRVLESTAFEQSLPAGKECALVDASGQVLAVAQVDSAGRSLHPRIVLMAE